MTMGFLFQLFLIFYSVLNSFPILAQSSRSGTQIKTHSEESLSAPVGTKGLAGTKADIGTRSSPAASTKKAVRKTPPKKEAVYVLDGISKAVIPKEEIPSFYRRHLSLLQEQLKEIPKNPYNEDIFNNIIIVNFYSKIIFFHTYSAELINTLKKIVSLFGYNSERYSNEEAIEVLIKNAEKSGHDPSIIRLLDDLFSFVLPSEDMKTTVTVNPLTYLSRINEELMVFTQRTIPTKFTATSGYHLQRDLEEMREHSLPDEDRLELEFSRELSSFSEGEMPGIPEELIIEIIILNHEFLNIYKNLTDLYSDDSTEEIAKLLKQKTKKSKTKKISEQDSKKLYEWLFNFKEQVRKTMTLHIAFLHQMYRVMRNTYYEDTIDTDASYIYFLLKKAKEDATLTPFIDDVEKWIEETGATEAPPRQRKRGPLPSETAGAGRGGSEALLELTDTEGVGAPFFSSDSTRASEFVDASVQVHTDPIHRRISFDPEASSYTSFTERLFSEEQVTGAITSHGEEPDDEGQAASRYGSGSMTHSEALHYPFHRLSSAHNDTVVENQETEFYDKIETGKQGEGAGSFYVGEGEKPIKNMPYPPHMMGKPYRGPYPPHMMSQPYGGPYPPYMMGQPYGGPYPPYMMGQPYGGPYPHMMPQVHMAPYPYREREFTPHLPTSYPTLSSNEASLEIIPPPPVTAIKYTRDGYSFIPGARKGTLDLFFTHGLSVFPFGEVPGSL